MSKLLRINLYLAIIGSWSVGYGMEDEPIFNTYSINDQTINIDYSNPTWYESLPDCDYIDKVDNPSQHKMYEVFKYPLEGHSNGYYYIKLPYKFSAKEIKHVQNADKRKVLENYYILVKYTFNVLLNKYSEDLIKQFNSNDNDNELIALGMQKLREYFNQDKLQNMSIYSPFSPNAQSSFSEVAKFFKTLCTTNVGLTYLRDIIRGHIYSIVIDSILKTNSAKLHMKNQNNGTQIYTGLWRRNYKYNILKNVIDPICNNIENEYRKKVVTIALKKFYLFEHQNISYENYLDYYFNIVGLQEDIYDKHNCHILISSMDSKFYRELLLDKGPHYNQQQQMILEGYITDPWMINEIFHNHCIPESTAGIKTIS